MNIKICSRKSILKESINYKHAIIIYESRDAVTDQIVVEVNNYFTSFLILCFDDIDSPQHGFISPNEEHIREALQYSINKEKLLVSCQAGISRSSSLSYILACNKILPKDAIKILDHNKHTPNELVIQIGTDILGNEDIWTEFDNWRIRS